MEFGERLQKELEVHGLSQTALAKQLGVSKQAVNQWTNQVSSPGPATLVRLEDLLGLPRGELLRMLGYRDPDDRESRLITLEEAIRAEEDLSAEHKRALLVFVKAAREEAAARRASPRYDVDLTDEDEATVWAQSALPEEERWQHILRLRHDKAADRRAG